MRISDWSSDVCSSDLQPVLHGIHDARRQDRTGQRVFLHDPRRRGAMADRREDAGRGGRSRADIAMSDSGVPRMTPLPPSDWNAAVLEALAGFPAGLKFVMSELAAKPDTAPRGQHLLGALALHPALARPFLIFSEYIAPADRRSTRLNPRH